MLGQAVVYVLTEIHSQENGNELTALDFWVLPRHDKEQEVQYMTHQDGLYPRLIPIDGSGKLHKRRT